MFDSLIRRNGHGENPAAPAGPPPATKPVVGLALGGGAARGFAHIGVLRTLAKHGITPDVVAGTSIRAVGGGCLATGHLDAFEEWARSLTPRGVLSYLDISLTGAGFINGARLATRLGEPIGNANIDELPVKIGAIA